MKTKKIIQAIKNPDKILIKILSYVPFIRNKIPDQQYLKIIYRNRFGRKLNLSNPETFNEKLQWLKLYDRKSEYTQMVDKHSVKEYIANKIGTEYVIPTLGVWDSFNEIDFNLLPNSFVLKATHDSGTVLICKNKNSFDIAAAKKYFNIALKKNFYLRSREWPYKDVPPRIIAEKYMVEDFGGELMDYKFFVFDGTVKAMFIATDRDLDTETCFDFYDRDFNHLPFTNGHPNSTREIKMPPKYEMMIELAEKLGKGIPQVRVDFYNNNGKIYFGEITFFHWGGFVPFKPEEWDYTFGSWISLPKN